MRTISYTGDLAGYRRYKHTYINAHESTPVHEIAMYIKRWMLSKEEKKNPWSALNGDDAFVL